MPSYVFKAVSEQNKVVTGRIKDATREGAIKKLRANNMTPISLKEAVDVVINPETTKKRRNMKVTEEDKRKSTAKVMSKRKETTVEKINKFAMQTSSQKITPRDIRIFTQNFYLLKKSNFNNIHALKTVIQTTENVSFKYILEDILSGVEAGDYMYKTMEYYNNVFPYIYINMIKVGELSGSLETSLEQAVKYIEESDSMKKRLKKMLLPNLMMFIGIWILLFAAVIFGVPMVNNLFDSLGSTETLPEITLKFAAFTDWLIQIWYVPVTIIIGAIAAFFVYISTPSGRYNWDYFKYKVVIFGKLIYLLDFQRLIKNMVLNLENGMRIQDSLEVSKNVVKNSVMLAMIETAINNIFVGKSWIEPFEEAGLGDSMTVEMLNIGMQSDLTEMMNKLLVYMDSDINNTIEKIMKVLPEVTYSVVGVVLIFFVVVVLVPILQLYMGGFLFSAYGF